MHMPILKNISQLYKIDDYKNWGSINELVSKKFALLKKPMNPSRFRTHPAAPELFALCVIPAVFLKGGKNVSADSA